MTCDWVTWIKIDLDTACENLNNASAPMTWDISYTKTELNRWELVMDFANDGQLKLECGSMSLKVFHSN